MAANNASSLSLPHSTDSTEEVASTPASQDILRSYLL